MRKQLGIFIASCWAAAAAGQDLLQCIDPDVRHGLLFLTPMNALEPVTRDVPAEIAALRVPESFAWIGSSDRGESLIGAYKTTGDTQVVLDAAVGAMAADGWTAPDEPGMSSAFASPTMERSQTLCKEENAVSISARLIDGLTYASYFVPKSAERSSCSVRSAMSPFESSESGMPSFDYAAFGGAPPRGRSGSASGLSTLRSTRVTVDAELGSLARELARQLNEQGWRQDAEWSGAVTAGSTWARTRDGKELAGTLDIVALGGTQFDVGFDLNELP